MILKFDRGVHINIKLMNIHTKSEILLFRKQLELNQNFQVVRCKKYFKLKIFILFS